MKIVNLQAENIMRLKAVEITPEGSVVIVGGNNGQGKSSILNSVWLAVGGGSASKAIARPVREGAEDAVVRLDLGDLIVTRTWKGTKSTLVVESPDGAKYSSPQTILDKLVGKFAFDPLEFSQYPAAQQREILLSLVDLPGDPAELDRLRKAAFDARTDKNREVKQLDGALKNLPPVPANTPDEELSLSDLLEEYRTASQENERTRLYQRDVNTCRATVSRLKLELAAAEENLKATEEALAARPPVVELAHLQATIDDAENINANVRAKQERAAMLENLSYRQAEADHYTKTIEELDATKAEWLAGANYPVKGLGFDESGVTFNGIPFKQASSAEQLRISTAMGMALNPGLRVMHIRDGSLLDDNSLDLINRMAEANDFQIWIERVGTKDEGAIVIEDGEVAA